MLNDNLRVAILIPTRNRADFIIRQLRYYESVNCPHTIYIGDSSNREDSEKIKNEINKLKNKINVVYVYLPTLLGGSAGASKYLLSITKEKYACFTGDDDYQIPNSLTVCAKFLENNPDYATVSGRALSFRLKNNGTYGDLSRLSDYPIPEILDETAAGRLKRFLSNNFVPLFFVNRTDQLLKSHGQVTEIKDHIFSSELLPCVLSIIAGKSTTLDYLSFVKQIHDKQYAQLQPSEWLIRPEWNESYKIFEKVASESVSKKDNISIEDAIKITRRSFLAHLLKWLISEKRGYDNHGVVSKRNYFYEKILKPARSKIVKAFPALKYIYRIQIKPRLTGKKELNYEVLETKSQYYKDFKPVIDSFTGLIN